jgi:hypothetical protein
MKLTTLGFLAPPDAPVLPKDLAILGPGVLQKISQNSPFLPNYFLCEEYNKWEVVV